MLSIIYIQTCNNACNLQRSNLSFIGSCFKKFQLIYRVYTVYMTKDPIHSQSSARFRQYLGNKTFAPLSRQTSTHDYSFLPIRKARERERELTLAYVCATKMGD